ncbi:SMP-30/gluconolactonase/LRE family protein [Desulfococcaceae bacterium HSG8]|nr:SMP-30/gluconolactonase/LRE family protein [Desulfococcaceae bacterium HSG8]
MKTKISNNSNSKRIFLALIIITILFPAYALPDETYKFEWKLPSLQRPFDFDSPAGIAADKDGNIYVADKYNNSIQKFGPDGNFITQWGSSGSGNGEFNKPYGIAADENGYVYVADTYNNSIQKFTSDGKFIAKWGSSGSGNGELDRPYGIAAGKSGYIYVADTYNNRIQKFSSNGGFIAEWGSPGSGDGEFYYPCGIAADPDETVYVADTYNNRIQKFGSDGSFIAGWGSQGSLEREFNHPRGIAADGNGNIYVADSANHRIQKFKPDGTFIKRWGDKGSENGEFNNPHGITADADGKIYVADTDNNRIQKFGKATVGQTYKFERMWPTLQQPWYFVLPMHVAIDAKGYVYIADFGNHRIQVFSADGLFVTKWGKEGSGDGEFIRPTGVAADRNGTVYVSDSFNNRIQVFSSDGTFIKKWENCISPGQGLPIRFEGADISLGTGGIAVDRYGNVYAADPGNHRIRKFGPGGDADWGGYGSGDGEFLNPGGIAADRSGNIYVADTGNHRIQKFSSDGIFLAKWGSRGSGDGEFYYPIGVAADANGDVYVTDSFNEYIQKFSPDGKFLAKWGSSGSGNGEFVYPSGIAVDENGKVYVADAGNFRIQKLGPEGKFITSWGNYGYFYWSFEKPVGATVGQTGLQEYIYLADSAHHITRATPNGEFITEWGTYGSGEETYLSYAEMAADGNGNLYVSLAADARIQKFGSDGKLVTEWGSKGSGDGEFDYPRKLALNENEDVYVADTYNHRIQKFDSDGIFDAKWGSKGSGDGEFDMPVGIAADRNGNIYVADKNNHRVQKFGSYGEFITKWGTFGTGDGQFSFPEGIAADKSRNIYVADTFNHRIQKFTSDGRFITKFGELGSDTGYLNFPYDVCVTSDGRVYVTEAGNFRVQIFKEAHLAEDISKAVIVAGGGPYPGNNIWEATQMCANFAYRTLTYQGFTKETIYYLTSDTDLDLDNNGEWDDVDGDATTANLQYAITRWASEEPRADNLVVYLVDHGRVGTFRMSETDVLYASDLKLWLDSAQTDMSGRVIFIYDACKSGSFQSVLAPPADMERIVITSTSPDENAHFVTQGSVSFSNSFWTHVFNGLDIHDSFNFAKAAMQEPNEFQLPLLGANTPTQDVYIGSGTMLFGYTPEMKSISPDQTITGTSSALLYASGVRDSDGIARVWAVIRPPGYTQELSDDPVQEFPLLDLMPVPGDEERYESTYEEFNIVGTYQIAVYARDKIGNTSVPMLTTVSVENPLRRRAIIAAGGSESDELWPVVEKNTALAYKALKFQGYSDGDIYFMSPVTFSTGVDAVLTPANLEYALGSWAGEDTEDVVLYLMGNGDAEAFEISSTEAVSSADLDVWLDDLQERIPGKVIVIYDACLSGSFVGILTPSAGRERIVLSSTGEDQPAYFLSGGDISFSNFFWKRVLNGENILDAFLNTWNAISLLCKDQTPYLDDNGNGIGNENSDGRLAERYTIGVGIMMGADDPTIGSVSPGQTLEGETSAAIRVEDVTTTGTLDRVWGIITPPDYSPDQPSEPVTDLPVFPLGHVGGGRYEGTYDDFSLFGTYRIVLYAMDEDGNISLPVETTVSQSAGGDGREEETAFNQSDTIVLNSDLPRDCDFDNAGDEKWIKIYGLPGETYTIAVKAADPDSGSIIIIDLYDTDGVTLLKTLKTEAGKPDLVLQWICTQDGVYYVNIRCEKTGTGAEYDLTVSKEVGSAAVKFEGTVTDAFSQVPVGNARIKTTGNVSALSFPEDGAYLMFHEPGDYTLTAEADGYETFTAPVTVPEEGLAGWRIEIDAAAGPKAAAPVFSPVPGRYTTGRRVEISCFTPGADIRYTTDGTVPAEDSLIYDSPLDVSDTMTIRARAYKTGGEASETVTGTYIIGTDLTDAILILQVLAGIKPSSAINEELDVNGDTKAGLAEIIHVLQKIMGQ